LNAKRGIGFVLCSFAAHAPIAHGPRVVVLTADRRGIAQEVGRKGADVILSFGQTGKVPEKIRACAYEPMHEKTSSTDWI
jgi:hypothetical protein